MHIHCLHGAWHGAWVWQALTEKLATQGHTVTSPDLPGLGKRVSEMHSSINLETHIVAATPDQPCWLIAHSYSGMLAKALTTRHKKLILGVVLIEAVWPMQSGQSLLDLLPAEAAVRIENSAKLEGEGWKIPPPPVSQFVIHDLSLANWVEKNLTPHPLATYQQPLFWESGLQPDVYIISSDRSPQPYKETAEGLAAEGTKVVELTGGHNLMLTNTTEIYEQVARAISSS